MGGRTRKKEGKEPHKDEIDFHRKGGKYGGQKNNSGDLKRGKERGKEKGNPTAIKKTSGRKGRGKKKEGKKPQKKGKKKWVFLRTRRKKKNASSVKEKYLEERRGGKGR